MGGERLWVEGSAREHEAAEVLLVGGGDDVDPVGQLIGAVDHSAERAITMS
jgi:hypothetical protein